MNNQVTTITFFRFSGFSNKWWGLGQMGKSKELFLGVPGLTFCKMLGSGAGNGFRVWPNFGVYGLLASWESERCADAFFKNHEGVLELKNRSEEDWTLYMKNVKTHGFWDNIQPFHAVTTDPNPGLTCVITRATIYTHHLLHFWKYVPTVSRSMEGKDGLLFAVGIGELPIIQQATFSVWTHLDKMKAYAYQSKYHKEVVRQTRQRGWYKEELFARFTPYREVGTWNGQELIKGKTSNHIPFDSGIGKV